MIYIYIYPIISRHVHVFVTVEPMVLTCLSLVFLSLYMPAHMYVIYQMYGDSFGSKTIRPRQIHLWSFWIINLQLRFGGWSILDFGLGTSFGDVKSRIRLIFNLS